MNAMIGVGVHQRHPRLVAPQVGNLRGGGRGGERSGHQITCSIMLSIGQECPCSMKSNSIIDVENINSMRISSR